MDREKAQSRGRSYCSVNGCFNTSENKKHISFFKHPADVERRTKWLELIGREELLERPGKHYCVCEEHFDKNDILAGTQRKTLKRNALPSLLLPNQPQRNTAATDSTSSNSHQESDEPYMDMETTVKIEDIDEDSVDSPSSPEITTPEATRKRKSTSPSPGGSKKVPEAQNSKVIILGQGTFHRLCKKFLTKELTDLVNAEYTVKDLIVKKKHDVKLMSLHLYHSSPQAYRMLQGTLHLPCLTNLHKNVVPITNETHCNFMSLLACKVKSMTDIEKNCSAIIGSLSLKHNLFYNTTHDIIIGFHEVSGVRLPELAEKGYVVMVQGIYSNWNQPVGYALLCTGDHSVEFNEWIDELLEQLFDIGLNVRTFVSDTGNDFIKAAKTRSVTVEKPHFCIKDKKIYYIFDAPHLIKLVRNHFMQHDFVFQYRVAKYEHVRSFYDKDKKRIYKLAPKLTKKHIQPTNFEKRELRYATQLLSNSVATGISTFVDFHVIDKPGRVTADFIKLMNNLFDYLNSSTLKDTDTDKRAFCGEQSQIDFFNEMLVFFRNLKLSGVSATYDVKFIEGFQITITSILQLFDDIKTEGYTFLPTRRLNLEAIDTLFGHIRTKYGIASNPTSWQFVAAYRKFLLSNFIKPKENKTSSDDLAKWLNQIQTRKLKEAASKQLLLAPDDDAEKTFKIFTSDYNNFEFNKKHSLFEVSHYLLEKCAEKHECKFFKSYSRPYKNIPTFIEESRYRYYRHYSEDQCKSLLVVPCDNFVNFVKKIDDKFVPYFKTELFNRKIGELLFKKIDECYPVPPCVCFPKTYLVKLFIRMKLYDIIKSNNKSFRLNRSNLGKIVSNTL